MTEHWIQGDRLSGVPDRWMLQIPLTGSAADRTLLRVRQGEQAVLTVALTDSKLTATVLFTARPVPIVLEALIGPGQTGPIRLVNTLNRIALFCGDTLLDEDWPLGTVDLNGATLTSAVSVTFSAASAADAGGTQPAPAVVRDILNWLPEGGNTGIGDCMPFYDNGCFHLFYLFDRRGHRSKWGLGAHQWAHLSTTDLTCWQQHPLAIALDDQAEGSICTGSVIRKGDGYLAFYAVRMADGTAARLTWSSSGDGIHFQKSRRSLHLAAPFEPASARDPFVFRDDSQLYHMLVTSTDQRSGCGCLAELTSADCLNWRQAPEPFFLWSDARQPECPDYFSQGDWHYLIFSIGGTGVYRMSRRPDGPWIKPDPDILGYPGLRVPKTACFGDQRRIMAGFVVCPPGNYAGRVDLLDIQAGPDGLLHFSRPAEWAEPVYAG